jgi:DNA primase
MVTFMSNDLEKFLQQAAERLRDKIQQSQANQRSSPPPPPPNRPSQRRSQAQSLEPLVIEATVLQPRQLGDDPLSTIDTRPSVAHEMRDHLAEDISQTDERAAGRLQQVFDHSVSTLPNASTALQTGATKSTDQTNVAVEVNRRGRMSSPFLRMLRKPDTLRAAFIAGEVFRRKF